MITLYIVIAVIIVLWIAKVTFTQSVQTYGLATGCGTVIIVLAIGGWISYSVITKQIEKRDKVAEIANQTQELSEKRAMKQLAFEKMRDFIMRENPAGWEQYTKLETAIEDQNQSIKAIAAAFKELGKDPNKDEAYVAEKEKLVKLESLMAKLRNIMETAYLDSIKFQNAAGETSFRETISHAGSSTEELSKISEQYNELLQNK